MSKQCLVLNSHALSDYQRCPQRYKLSAVEKLESREAYRPFKRGAVWSVMMEQYYKALRAQVLNAKSIMEIIMEHLRSKVELTIEDREMMEQKFLRYYGHYKHEDWIPLAMEEEAAFSKVIYEDAQYLFIYEGKPDLLGQLSSREEALIVVDHKTQSRKSELYPFNNQSIGYLWALQVRFFCYNITGLIETGGPKDWFRRPVTSFGPDAIASWREETIRWFFRIARDQDYLRSLQCEGKYGICTYHKICEQPYVNIQESIKEREFKKKEYESWTLSAPITK